MLEANTTRIENALRTLLAEPGSPHSGAAAALEDLNDRNATAEAARQVLADLGE